MRFTKYVPRTFHLRFRCHISAPWDRHYEHLRDEEKQKIHHLSQQQYSLGNLRAMPLSPCHPALLRDPSRSCSECHSPCSTPAPSPGGLTRTRPSALGCRARLTPIHSSSRSSRQVFPQDMPRWFPAGRREKPVLGVGKMVCWLLFQGRSTPPPQMSATSSGGNKDAQEV